MFDYDQLYSNPDYVVRIDTNDGELIKGIISTDFDIKGSANYTSIWDLSGQKKLKLKLSMVTSIVGMKPIHLKDLKQTIDFWEDSSRPSFNIEFAIIAVHTNDNVMAKTKRLFRLVYPIRTGAFTISPPLNYNGSPDNFKLLGTITIQIGRRFFLTNMIATDVSTTYSKEITSNGTPLMAKVSLGFHPYRDLAYDDIERMYIL